MTALPGKVNLAKSDRGFFLIITMQQFDQDRVSLKPDRKDGAFTVLQITDTHLFGKPGSTLVGLDTPEKPAGGGGGGKGSGDSL